MAKYTQKSSIVPTGNLANNNLSIFLHTKCIKIDKIKMKTILSRQ